MNFSVSVFNFAPLLLGCSTVFSFLECQHFSISPQATGAVGTRQNLKTKTQSNNQSGKQKAESRNWES
jgi:hypothetical protein